MVRQGAISGRYRMKNEGAPSQRGLQGMYLLNDGAGCQIYRPTWQGTRTIFRPFPARDPDNPEQWDPFRLSDEDRDFGDWVRRYDMAFSIGSPGITFVLKDPRDNTTDDQQNPVWMLYRAIQQAVKSGQGLPAWNPLIFGATGRAAPLSAPKDGYIMQGILMEHKSKPQNPPKGCVMDHQPVVMMMSQSAGQAMLDMLSEKNEEGGWLHPDLIDLDAGGFIQFHQAGTQNAPAAGGGQMGANMTVGATAGGTEIIGYEAKTLDTYQGISSTFPGIHELAAAHVKPWDEIVRIPTIEEQVRMLCTSGIPASAIVYALGEVYPDMIPQHIYDQAQAQQQQANSPLSGATGAVDPNPMAAGQPEASPMGAPAEPAAAPTVGGASQPTMQSAGQDSQPDPGMAAAQQQAAVTNAMGTQPATPAAQPAAAPMVVPGQATMPSTQPNNPPAEQAGGFAPQPSHADGQRSQSTMDALAKARARSQAASPPA